MEQSALLARSVHSTAQQEAAVQHGLKPGVDHKSFLDLFVHSWICVRSNCSNFCCPKRAIPWGPDTSGRMGTFSQAADRDTDSLCSLLSGLLNMKRAGLEELRKQWRSEAEMRCLEVCHSALVTGGVMGTSGMFLVHQWSGPLSKMSPF